jgi:cell division protein FtsB
MVHTAAMHQPNVRRRSGGEFLPVATRVMWALITVALLLTIGFWFYPEWARLSSMKRDLATQQQHLADLKKKSAEHEQEVKLLQNDPQYLEFIAREKLDLMKNGETIFRLNSPQPRS